MVHLARSRRIRFLARNAIVNVRDLHSKLACGVVRLLARVIRQASRASTTTTTTAYGRNSRKLVDVLRDVRSSGYDRENLERSIIAGLLMYGEAVQETRPRRGGTVNFLHLSNVL